MWDAAGGDFTLITTLTTKPNTAVAVSMAWSPAGTQLATSIKWANKVEVWGMRCGAGEHLVAADGACTECDAGEYMDSESHSATSCKPQTLCEPGEEISADSKTVVRYASGTTKTQPTCITCPPGQFKPSESTTSTATDTCTPRNPANVCNGFATAINTETGACDCDAGLVGYDCECYEDPSDPNGCIECASKHDRFTGPKCQYGDTRTCSGAGVAQPDGSCECNGPATGIGPTCSEFSNSKTCNDLGTASYDADAAEPNPKWSCSCTGPATGTGPTCIEYSNAATCANRGTATATGGCIICDPGFAGSRCQFSDAITCHGRGKAAADGSCACTAVGFDPSVQCESCKPKVTGRKKKNCDRCTVEWYHSSFPACDIPACSVTHSNAQNPDTGECVCNGGWSGSRCECFRGGSSTCKRCADDDDLQYDLNAERASVSSLIQPRPLQPRGRLQSLLPPPSRASAVVTAPPSQPTRQRAGFTRGASTSDGCSRIGSGTVGQDHKILAGGARLHLVLDVQAPEAGWPRGVGGVNAIGASRAVLCIMRRLAHVARVPDEGAADLLDVSPS
jgi:hypothetical protein